MNREDEQRERLMAALGRIADGVEKLASEPEIEIRAGPPICPHCGVFDPVISTRESSGEGTLSDYVIAGVCKECEQEMYAVIDSFSMHRDVETATQELEIRRKVGFADYLNNKLK